ncbi:hemolysin family protein [Arthrobacter sp. H14]|uniref:hemolysin family protein n=1 Tax=Arthrobacter sp. H14 TaxID=1312959 RepID=UPI00047C725C|nr:hemolysin family protein [Arthrobacter sp. H14]
MSDWVGLVWLVVLLLANAFFVGSEFAVMSARRSQIEPLAEEGHKRAKTTLWAMENVSLMLACSQLGITVCSLLILNISEPAIHHLLEIPLLALGVPEGLSDGLAFGVALLLVTFLHVTFGEMVPKNISVSVADKAALLLAPPLVMVSKAVRPVIASLNWTANHILRLMRIEPKDEVSSTFTLEEVRATVEESTRHGLLADDTGLLAGALEFSAYTAGRIMVPIEDLVTLDVGTTPAEFERSVARTGFSRFVLADRADNLTGYLHLKDVLSMDESLYSQGIDENRVRTMANIRVDDEIEDALAIMQRTGSHLARVMAPDGTTKGVLFLEDVIEQLVGEIRDATQAQGLRRLGGPRTE